MSLVVPLSLALFLPDLLLLALLLCAPLLFVVERAQLTRQLALQRRPIDGRPSWAQYSSVIHEDDDVAIVIEHERQIAVTAGDTDGHFVELEVGAVVTAAGRGLADVELAPSSWARARGCSGDRPGRGAVADT